MWIDITMPIQNHLAVWPGDLPVEVKIDYGTPESKVNVGSLKMSLHAGTHVDAPFHYDSFGKSIDTLPLDLFIGPVQIIDATKVSLIDQSFLETVDFEKNIQRVFFKTKMQQNFMVFDENFTSFTKEAIYYLATKGIALLGTDSPSIDAMADATLQAHLACKETGIIIVENLVLKNVEAGNYEFIGVPLSIQGGDGSPIRAIIKKAQQMEEEE